MPSLTDFTDPEAFSLHSPVEQLHLVLQSSWMNFYPAGGAKKKSCTGCPGGHLDPSRCNIWQLVNVLECAGV